SRLMARQWIAGLSATRSCSVAVAEIGDKATVRLTIRQRGWLPGAWILVEDLLPRRALDKRFPALHVEGKRIKVAMIPRGGELARGRGLACRQRGSPRIGRAVAETGDRFGLHRRFRVMADPAFLLVMPRIVSVTGYDLASRRPIGEVRLTHRLYEDPTR